MWRTGTLGLRKVSAARTLRLTASRNSDGSVTVMAARIRFKVSADLALTGSKLQKAIFGTTPIEPDSEARCE
jgi:hypothetical protein